MRQISEQELKVILDKHAKWLRREGFVNPKLAKSLDYSYWVSECGEIASAINPCLSPRETPLILKERLSNKGYRQFVFRRKNVLVHRVIAEEFLGPVKGKVVHHKNANRSDNRVLNLTIVGASENNSEGFQTRIKMYGSFIVSCLEHFKNENLGDK